MVDYFALGITHLLLALVAWRLLTRDELDSDPEEADPPPAPRTLVNTVADHA